MNGSRVAVWCVGLVAGLCLGSNAGAQWNPLNPVQTFEKKGQALEVLQKDGLLRIEVDASGGFACHVCAVGCTNGEACFRSCDRQERLACDGLHREFRREGRHADDGEDEGVD